MWEKGGRGCRVLIITYYLYRVHVSSQVGAMGSASCVAEGNAGDCNNYNTL